MVFGVLNLKQGIQLLYSVFSVLNSSSLSTESLEKGVNVGGEFCTCVVPTFQRSMILFTEHGPSLLSSYKQLQKEFRHSLLISLQCVSRKSGHL